ncbi:MAG: YhgE/Pip domain-containing protein, partial [Pseudonocardiaceae bacterium]
MDRAGAKATRTLRLWATPIVLTLAVLSALAGLYLGGVLRPRVSLRGFPVAVVNEDVGPAGRNVLEALHSGLDKDKFDVRVLSHDEALRQLDTAQIYGAAAIPPDFSAKLQTFAATAMRPGHADRPVITISTNPRAGTLGASIAGQSLTQAIAAVQTRVGGQLSTRATHQTGGAPMASAALLMLASPINIQNTEHNPLPAGTGNGLSAFYYSLLLLLAGFTGSIMIGPLVDSMLGHAPAQFGPVYQFAQPVNISRFRTLLIKWALMVVLAVLTSAVFMAIADVLGMPIVHG